MAMVEIIAHRGYHKKERENTIGAFLSAVEIGADWVELDVWRTEDGVLVVYHNPAVDTDEPWFLPEEERKHTLVRDLRYEEFASICKSRGFDPPVLDEVLSTLRGKIKVDIEVKMPGIEKDVLHAVENTNSADSVMFSSFYDVVLREFYRLAPDIPRGMILGFPVAALGHRLTEFWPYKRMEIVGAEYVIPHEKLLMCRGYIWQVHRHGKKIWPWPVNDQKKIKKLIRSGVDGIITDRPDVALKVREEMQVRRR